MGPVSEIDGSLRLPTCLLFWGGGFCLVSPEPGFVVVFAGWISRDGAVTQAVRVSVRLELSSWADFVLS